ncbi:trigger factor [Candidatus Peregrinibacteria bacterium HGW-Peregrinibacteria-1]|jgi:trigger factor|nr:MAG: trigger factor [Candidatus Peregrinibacteria bacterium HGW-Peregrinibacteria-1]
MSDKKHTIKKLPKSEIEIVFEIADTAVEDAMKQAISEYAQDVKIKGFRPGKAPSDMIEKVVGKELLVARAQDLAIQKTYVEIVIAEDLQVVGRPKVEIAKETPLTIKATVPVKPEVDIKDYDKIKVPAEKAEVTDKELEEVFNDMRKSDTTFTDVDRAAQKGDRVEVDFEGFDAKTKEPVPNTNSSNHPVVLGEGSLIPGFEEQLIGLKKDQEKEFDITFPEDYHQKDFQKKKLTFKAKINRIEEQTLPELNDEFVKKFSGKDMTVAEFTAHIKKNLTERKEEENKQKRENAYIEALIEKMTVEIPHSLIHDEAHHILEDMKAEISQKGASFEDVLKRAGNTEEELATKYEKEAERRLKVRLAIEFLIEKEKIQATEDDIKAELDNVKSFYPKEQHSKIDKDFKKGNLKNNIANRVTLRKLFEKVLA